MGRGAQIGAGLKEGLRPVIDLVYPPRCPLCGMAIADQGGLCIDCFSELELPSGSLAQDGEVIAATLYNEASRKLILSFKHGGKIALASLLGQLMAARLPPADGEPALLIPVPLHRTRLWQRGFNQAALLAREIEKRGKGELLVDGLTRRKRTPSLGGLGKEEREAALAGAITVRARNARRIAGRDVILVDDVLTSGATSNACIEALVEAGAKTIRVACFARVNEGPGRAASRDDGLGEGQSGRPKSETPEAETAPGAT